MQAVGPCCDFEGWIFLNGFGVYLRERCRYHSAALICSFSRMIAYSRRHSFCGRLLVRQDLVLKQILKMLADAQKQTTAVRHCQLDECE